MDKDVSRLAVFEAGRSPISSDSFSSESVNFVFQIVCHIYSMSNLWVCLRFSQLEFYIIVLRGSLFLFDNFSNVLLDYLAKKFSHNLGKAPSLLYYMIQKHLHYILPELMKILDHL